MPTNVKSKNIFIFGGTTPSLKNQVLNTLHHIGVSSLLRAKKDGLLTVLSLHRISEERNSFWNPIHPKTFDQLLGYVKKNYRVIGFNELENENHSKSNKPLLILSFDDGYYDFYQHALPLLVKHNLPSNHNIVNECASSNRTIWTQKLNLVFEHHLQTSSPLTIDYSDRKSSLADFGNSWMTYYLDTFKTLLNLPLNERESVLNNLIEGSGIDLSCRMMNWEEIKECSSNLVEIGSHTFTHDSLGTIKDVEALKKEILESKTQTENALGKKVDVFALPNGQTGSLADEVITNSDYKFVLYANDELNAIPDSNSHGPIKISRINLVDEPLPHMALRLEQFHKMLRKYV